MSQHVAKTKIVERTRAVVTFEDGRTQEFRSVWGDSQEGRGYDGGNWGPFPDFRDRIEEKVSKAQRDWGLPAATIRYHRETRTEETIVRVTETAHFYTERRVHP